MNNRFCCCLTLALALHASAATAGPDEAAAQVRAAETAFAASMAARDLQAFQALLDEEAVFFGGAEPARGKAAVAAQWAAFFEGPEAPFSWAPEVVEVLASGDLALSSGPVFSPDGKRVATFNSIWRRGADGHWRVIFDKGSRDCPDPATAPASP